MNAELADRKKKISVRELCELANQFRQAESELGLPPCLIHWKGHNFEGKNADGLHRAFQAFIYSQGNYSRCLPEFQGHIGRIGETSYQQDLEVLQRVWIDTVDFHPSGFYGLDKHEYLHLLLFSDPHPNVIQAAAKAFRTLTAKAIIHIPKEYRDKCRSRDRLPVTQWCELLLLQQDAPDKFPRIESVFSKSALFCELVAGGEMPDEPILVTTRQVHARAAEDDPYITLKTIQNDSSQWPGYEKRLGKSKGFRLSEIRQILCQQRPRTDWSTWNPAS